MNTDLVLVDGDLLIDGNGDPIFFNGKQVIEQSLRNRIFEHNFMVDMIGDRSPTNRQAVYQAIKREVETDERIVPGTCTVAEENNSLSIYTKSVDGDELNLFYNLDDF